MVSFSGVPAGAPIMNPASSRFAAPTFSTLSDQPPAPGDIAPAAPAGGGGSAAAAAAPFWTLSDEPAAPGNIETAAPVLVKVVSMTCTCVGTVPVTKTP